MSTGLGPAVCPPGWLWEDFCHGRLAQLTRQLASHRVDRASTLRLLWAVLPPCTQPHTVNPGAPVLGTPMFTTGLLGTVCWLGRP